MLLRHLTAAEQGISEVNYHRVSFLAIPKVGTSIGYFLSVFLIFLKCTNSL